MDLFSRVRDGHSQCFTPRLGSDTAGADTPPAAVQLQYKCQFAMHSQYHRPGRQRLPHLALQLALELALESNDYDLELHGFKSYELE